MAQICIFYASPDRAKAGRLAELLGANWSVWWDHEIVSGNWREHVERELNSSECKCAIVIWSAHSRNNETVIDEAELARKLGKDLISLFIERVIPPLRFGGLSPNDFVAWDGSSDAPPFRELVRRLERIIGRKASPARRWDISVNDKKLQLPAFIRSVSSFETQIPPSAALRMIGLSGTDPLLVSAYDIDGESGAEVVEQLKECWSKGIFIMMDSGNYESYRKTDEKWSSDPVRFADAFSIAPSDFAFCHDKVMKFPVGGTAPTAESVAAATIESVNRDIKATRSNRIMPIIHAPREEGSSYVPDLLPEICFQVARELRPAVIAVPERELGQGLICRAQAVVQIRSKLNTLGWYQPIHLLGTGNPRSIALLCAAGADICDGLEWCRTVIDRDTFNLFHYQHYDFFDHQTGSPRSPIVREVLQSDSPYGARVGFHNLEVFSDLELQIRSGIRKGSPQDILIHMFGKAAFDQKIAPALPEIFGK